MNVLDSLSARSYLIRALYEWCTDHGLTPYVAVAVDGSVQVPREYVQNDEIVLNISFDATSSLKLGNDFIEFKARFAGTARDIMVPIGRVIAIYARENGQGVAFSAQPSATTGAPVPPSMTQTKPASTALAVTPSPNLMSGSQATDTKLVQLVVADSGLTAGAGDSETSPPPKPKQGGRPSLKRIK